MNNTSGTNLVSYDVKPSPRGANEFDVNRLERLRELGGFLGLRECGELPRPIDDATAEFIDFMLVYDWQERPNIQEVLSHDWFN